MLEQEKKALIAEVKVLNARKAELNTEINNKLNTANSLHEKIVDLKKSKVRELDNCKEDQKKIAAIREDIRKERGRLVEVNNEIKAVLEGVERREEKLEEGLKIFRDDCNRLGKATAKNKEETRELNAQKVYNDRESKKNEEETKKNSRVRKQLADDNLDLVQTKKNIDKKFEEIEEELSGFKKIKEELDNRNKVAGILVSENKNKSSILDASIAEEEKLIKEKEILNEKIVEKSDDLDKEKKSLASLYDDIEKKKQENEIQRLRLLKIAKEKDTKKQIEELKKEVNEI